MMLFSSKTPPSPVNQIFIRDMVVEMGIGVFDEEKGRKQRVRINLIAEPIIWPNAAADNIDDTVSYDELVQIIFHHTGAKHIHLVESLAERIADDCLKKTAIRRITVRIEKLDIYPFAIPGVEIIRAQRR